MIWYRANRNYLEIQEVEVEKETYSCLIINGNRCFKRTNYDAYFPTRDGAKDYIVYYYQSRAVELEDRLESVREQIKKAKSL
jgi:hypothetical protein